MVLNDMASNIDKYQTTTKREKEHSLQCRSEAILRELDIILLQCSNILKSTVINAKSRLHGKLEEKRSLEENWEINYNINKKPEKRKVHDECCTQEFLKKDVFLKTTSEPAREHLYLNQEFKRFSVSAFQRENKVKNKSIASVETNLISKLDASKINLVNRILDPVREDVKTRSRSIKNEFAKDTKKTKVEKSNQISIKESEEEIEKWLRSINSIVSDMQSNENSK